MVAKSAKPNLTAKPAGTWFMSTLSPFLYTSIPCLDTFQLSTFTHAGTSRYTLYAWSKSPHASQIRQNLVSCTLYHTLQIEQFTMQQLGWYMVNTKVAMSSPMTCHLCYAVHCFYRLLIICTLFLGLPSESFLTCTCHRANGSS